MSEGQIPAPGCTQRMVMPSARTPDGCLCGARERLGREKPVQENISLHPSICSTLYLRIYLVEWCMPDGSDGSSNCTELMRRAMAIMRRSSTVISQHPSSTVYPVHLRKICRMQRQNPVSYVAGNLASLHRPSGVFTGPTLVSESSHSTPYSDP